MSVHLLRKKKVLVLAVIALTSIYFATYMFRTPLAKTSYIVQTLGGAGPIFNSKSQQHLQLVQVQPNATSSLQSHDRNRSTNDTAVSPVYGSCSLVKDSRGTDFKQDQYVYFTEKFKLDKEPVATWFRNSGRRSACDDRLVVFDDQCASLRHALMRPSYISGLERQAKGGEEVRHVLRQGLDKEDYKFSAGFLELNCSSAVSNAGSFKLLRSVIFKSTKDSNKPNDTEIFKSAMFDYEPKFTIAVVRIDYANLHNWARQVYNVIILMMYFNVQPKDTVVLFLDGHPFTNLDYTWSNLVGSVKRVGHLTRPVMFRHLVLGFEESKGLVSDFRRKESAYLEECRAYILQQHNLNPQSFMKCRTPTITLLIRRNAVFHPRNVEGKVGRKIYNEAELIDGLMATFPGACVQGVLMEALPMRSQLQIISQTDLLIGMHGAGMTHSLFLPQHAGLLELFAKDFKRDRPWFECFHSIAKWRGLKYDSWENFDAASEMPFDFTIVPVNIVVQKAKQLLDKMCL